MPIFCKRQLLILVTVKHYCIKLKISKNDLFSNNRSRERYIIFTNQTPSQNGYYLHSACADPTNVFLSMIIDKGA